MNISQSQYNSECESGWTHYLDQSYLSGSHGIQKGDDYVGTKPEFEEEEREEDLSMLSDASSGPPHYQELYEDGCSLSVDSSASKLGKKSKKKKSKESRGKEQHHHLDETASSSVFNYYSKANSKFPTAHALILTTDSKPISILSMINIMLSFIFLQKKMSTISKDEPPMLNVMDYSEGFSATHMKVLLVHSLISLSSANTNIVTI